MEHPAWRKGFHTEGSRLCSLWLVPSFADVSPLASVSSLDNWYGHDGRLLAAWEKSPKAQARRVRATSPPWDGHAWSSTVSVAPCPGRAVRGGVKVHGGCHGRGRTRDSSPHRAQATPAGPPGQTV